MEVTKETSDKRLVECLFGDRHDVPTGFRLKAEQKSKRTSGGGRQNSGGTCCVGCVEGRSGLRLGIELVTEAMELLK